MIRRIGLITLLAAATPTVSVWAKSVRDGYPHPTFAMPYAWEQPNIDGVVDEAEWQQGLSMTTLQSVSGQVNTHQTTFRVCWDEENILPGKMGRPEDG